MYSNIIKEYKRKDPFKIINKFYFKSLIIICPVFFIILSQMSYKSWIYWILYIIMFILIFIVFYIYLNQELNRVLGNNHRKWKIYANIKLYSIQLNKRRIEELLKIMMEYNFKTKEDLTIAFLDFDKLMVSSNESVIVRSE